MEVVVIGGSGVIGSKVVAKQATEMLGEGAEDAAEVPPAGDRRDRSRAGAAGGGPSPAS